MAASLTNNTLKLADQNFTAGPGGVIVTNNMMHIFGAPSSSGSITISVGSNMTVGTIYLAAQGSRKSGDYYYLKFSTGRWNYVRFSGISNVWAMATSNQTQYDLANCCICVGYRES